MSSTQTLLSFVERQTTSEEISLADVHGIMREAGWPVENVIVRLAVESAISGPLRVGAGLEWSLGAWRIKTSGGMVNGVICSGLLWGILKACGAEVSIPTIVIPSVISILFDIERVTLTLGEQDVLLRLTPSAGFREGSPQDLYNSLNESVRDHLRYFDFLSLLEKLQSAGHATAKDGYWKIFPAGQKKFRVEFE